MYDLQIIESRIMEIASKKRLSKNKLLINAQLGKSFFDNMKKGRVPSVDKIHTIANYLNCSVDYILGRTDNIGTYEPLTPLSEVQQSALDEDEQDILRIYRSLARRDKHEFMTMVYNYETKDTDKKEMPKSKNKSMVG